MVTDLKHEALLGKSHHQVLTFDFTCYTAEQDEVKNDRFNFVESDYDNPRNMMGAHDWEEELKDLDTVNAWQYVENEMMNAMKEIICKKRWHKKKKPLWMNEDALKKVRKKR